MGNSGRIKLKNNTCRWQNRPNCDYMYTYCKSSVFRSAVEYRKTNLNCIVKNTLHSSILTLRGPLSHIHDISSLVDKYHDNIVTSVQNKMACKTVNYRLT